MVDNQNTHLKVWKENVFIILGPGCLDILATLQSTADSSNSKSVQYFFIYLAYVNRRAITL